LKNEHHQAGGQVGVEEGDIRFENKGPTTREGLTHLIEKWRSS